MPSAVFFGQSFVTGLEVKLYAQAEDCKQGGFGLLYYSRIGIEYCKKGNQV
jgi:hypothetical protein